MSICDSNKCTSCMACYNSCPRNCITMEYDKYGILSPQINENICIRCSLFCPVNNNVNKNEPKEAYACWSLDENERKSSSSGGIASIFYAHFIQNKHGSAYGCSYDENLQLKFSRATTLEELEKYKTSKYSQGYIGNTYKEIEKDLKSGLYSVFVGTPCQIAGLKSYLKKDYENLLTLDLICHGVPSQKYIDEYIKSLNLKESPDNLTFRGNLNFFFSLYKNKEVIFSENSNTNPFFKAFLDGLFYRDNCYSCEYANTNRVRRYYNWRFLGTWKRYSF